jgi:hypothetical protein
MGGGGTLSLSRGWRGLSLRVCRGVVGGERRGTGGLGSWVGSDAERGDGGSSRCEVERQIHASGKKRLPTFCLHSYFLGVEISCNNAWGITSFCRL